MRCRFLLGSTSLLLAVGCQGDYSAKPPVHLNPNMDQQMRFDPQEPNRFFADQRAMRSDVAGTVARGELGEDDHLYRGKREGQFADDPPAAATPAMLARGRERFNIYCAPCHDRTGGGKGIVAIRGQRFGMVQPPSFAEARVRALPIGQVFDTISNGVRTMPAYGAQIPVPDRWAIATYVRALQLSGGASWEQVPEAVRQKNGWPAPEAPASAPSSTQPAGQPAPKGAP